MKSEMTAVEFCHAHGHTFVRWLKSNTVECACEQKYACDETKRHGVITIDAEKEILCRRCFVPIGLHPVSLRAPIPGPAPRKFLRACSLYLGSCLDGCSCESCSCTHRHIAVDGRWRGREV